ncbi:YcjF family protein [Pseudorhodobacter sp. MZDSW-24AT]|uniref:YcjF family protein n=1 Tax=Pseudorhodobacter sp. MZDSW-24AT TaxID=2052957 RepID=UPI000C1EDD48|nr:TIGR01620 family protein [Pseudorhodobacter sp. MZDSW-24AT]PJF07944.1 TIGR01620 family protein [Pseudorhodobacter sp. MZDSW-24AT]
MTDLPPPARKPLILELEEELDPAAAAPVPDDLPQGQAMQLAARLRAPRSPLARFALWAFTAFFTFALSVAAYDFVTGLFARNPLLGWVAGVLLALALLAAVLLAGREWSAYLRLQRLDHLRQAARTARQSADLKSARRTVAALTGLYAARADTAWGRARLAEREAEVLDADALLSLAEAELLPPLDARARAEVEAAARQVAMVTALVPLALADVATALVANLRMVRRIAEIYGGRSGALGSWGLLRRVFASLLAAGALALTDDLIGSVAGGGVLAKLSRRFGEGVVNGALTARVGLAAIELCRPMPFVAVERPSTSGTVSRALAGLIPRKS